MDDLNAMGDDYVFEVIEADSGCDGQMAGTATQSLVDAGVVAVAGAACSGASMGANAVLSVSWNPHDILRQHIPSSERRNRVPSLLQDRSKRRSARTGG